jgi:hypothetical protein
MAKPWRRKNFQAREWYHRTVEGMATLWESVMIVQFRLEPHGMQEG